MEEESSNFKELKNLVDTVDEEAKAGRLQYCEFSYLRTIQRLKGVSTEEAQNPDTSMLLYLRSGH